MPSRSGIIETADQLVAITHPTRLRVLDALRTPDSAAGAARKLGEPRQRINHHVRELVERGTARRRGGAAEGKLRRTALRVERRARSCFRPGSRGATASDVQAIADQVSLQHLVEFGERLQRDAATLLDRAAFDGEQIPSATVEATVRFADAEARAAFMDEYLELTARLVERHASAVGTAFTVGIVVHPTVEEADS